MGWTVLLVDDHAGFRRAARALLEADAFSVVGETADGESTLAAVQSLRPDVVLLDIHLPGMDGFDVARALGQLGTCSAAVVLISSRPASAYRRRLSTLPDCEFLAKADLSGPTLAELLTAAGRTG